MAGMFCRHNRLTANCPICSREQAAQRPAPARGRTPARTATHRAGSPSPRRSARPSRGGAAVRTKRLARATDDGYRNPLVPGLRATSDAERLAAALAAAAARLDPPGPYPELAAERDEEQALWLGFLLALAGTPERRALVADSDAAVRGIADASAEPLPGQERTVAAYRGWAQRAGSQAAGLAGEAGWDPQRRFARAFERLALPGFGRGARYDFLTAVGAAGRADIVAGELFPIEDDAATVAAKRLLVSGDRMLLERRAKDLADAAGLQIAALDRGLADWDARATDAAPRPEPEPGAGGPARLDAVRAALGLA